MTVLATSLRFALLGASFSCPPAWAAEPSRPEAIGEPTSRGRFATLREPSGVTALDARTLMVVEDEPDRALRRLEVLSGDPANFRFREFDQAPDTAASSSRRVAPLDDLEGIARVSSERFFVIGSHRDAGRGTRPDRQKLALLTRDGDDITSTAMRRDLFDRMTSRYAKLAAVLDGGSKGKRRALNIEAIAFDRRRQVLHVGLRTPLLNDDAVIVSLTNAVDYALGADPAFASEPTVIDLESGGIRAMAYDDRSDTLLIVSERESGRGGATALWRLGAAMGSVAVRYESEDEDLFEDVEGLTPLAEGVLFVRDKGDKGREDDEHWFMLERFQLGLDD